MTVESTLPAEAVLDDLLPEASLVAVLGQCCQRHAQISRREAVQFPAHAARGAAVVRDGDDGGHVIRDGAPRAQGGEESVATTERYEALEGLVTRVSSGRGGRVINQGVIVMRHEVQLPSEQCVLPTRRGTKG